MDCRERLNWSLALLLAFWASGCGTGRIEPPRKEDVKKIMEISVQHFDKVEQVKYPWGWIRWLMNSKLDPGAAQTFGVVEIAAGQRNSLHMHPNCEELLYVLSGSCKHRIGDKSVVLKPGDIARIPAGVAHQAIVLGNEPMRAVISYSSGDRQVVDLGPGKE
jgi:quercetin dioxygenase-like cupin family protein